MLGRGQAAAMVVRRGGKSIGPWDHWSQKNTLIPRKIFFPRKNKIVIIYITGA